MRLKYLQLCIGTALLTQVSSFAAHAQEQDEGNQNVERIRVTGSNIARSNIDVQSTSPIQVMGKDIIDAAGAGQVQDLFKNLSVNTGSEMSTSQNSRQGLSQFSLRGLGVSGTLTLVNGRRAGVAPVASDDGFFFTDINQYPVNMIERVEVLTDGASATYGSEAVGGVVNIITRKNFEGFEFGAEVRDATNQAYQFNMAVGSAFENGRFNTFVNYYEQDGNFRSEFDFIQERSNNNGNGLDTASDFDSGTGAGRYNLAVLNADGEYERSGITVADAHCAESGPGNFVDGSNCRYNFIDQRRLIAEETRLQVFSQFDYDVTDNINVYGEFSYSTNEIRDAIGGAVLRTTTHDGGFLVPGTHAFNYFVSDGNGGIVWDEAAIAADPTQAVDVIVRQRPLTSAFDGPNADDIVRDFDNTRTLIGIQGDLTDDLLINASYMYARAKMTDIQPRSYNAQAFSNAIIDGTWNPFGIATANPTAVSLKDGETLAGNTDADIDVFAANRTFTAETVQKVAEVIVSGEMFELPNGNPVAMAFGAQWREFTYNDIADSLSEFRLDGRADPVFSIVDATQDVYAVFTEAAIEATDDLEIQLALRYEDYGDEEGGDTTDPKVGIKYQATESILLRGSWGTSFQAPSIRNVVGAVGSGALDDRAVGLQAGDPCLANAEPFNAAQLTNGAELEPQSATNYNLGFVFDGDSGFTTSLDYFVYDYEDLIQTGEDFQTIVDNECSTGNYVPDERVVRDASGQLNSVTSNFVNVGKVEATGLDWTASYTFDDVMNGELRVNSNATYVTKFDVDLDGSGTVFDGAGNRNRFIGFGSIPDLRANLGMTWQNDAHMVGVTLRYISDYRDDIPGTEGQDIDSQTLVDVQYNLALDDFFGTSTNVTLGVNNLFDDEPPEVDTRIAFDGQVHDPRGRIVYLRTKTQF